MKYRSIHLTVLFSLCFAFLNLFAGRAAGPTPILAAPQQPSVQLEQVVSGLSFPVYVTNARDGSNRLFIVEMGGIIKVLQPGATSPTIFLNITERVVSGGEQGLLGLAFHPHFKNNGRFFVNYTRKPDGATVIAEYRASASNPDVADTSETVLLTIAQPFANHNGGMVEFGPDGFLYIALGDGGSGNDPGNRAQNTNELLGKILRIDVDHANGAVPYSSPFDNPFFGSTAGRDEIYAYGFRNPWRFSFDRATGQLYVGDVGQGQREEVDIVTLGGNYGWRVFEGTLCTGLGPAPCTQPGFIGPITEYSHDNDRCSITGGYVYRGQIGTLPVGTYVFADFCTGEIFRFSGGTQSLLLDTNFLVSTFGEDETGELYVADIVGGIIYRLVNPNATCSFVINPTNRSFPAAGGTGNVTVAAPLNCNWTAVSNTGIASITASDGSGYGAVAFSVGANTSGAARSGTMTVAGRTFTILQGASFADVAAAHAFANPIGRLSAREVTVGCGTNAQGRRIYCPSDLVTREQMAAFIIRALGEFNPPSPAQQRFADVPASNLFYAFIDRMAALGITTGCGTNAQGQPIYCPSQFVTRQEMAAFIIRALGEFNPPSPVQPRFADVPMSSPFYGFIDLMDVRGITVGCGTNAQGQRLFCPSDFVTREQMAAFLVRAFNL